MKKKFNDEMTGVFILDASEGSSAVQSLELIEIIQMVQNMNS